MYLYVCVMLAKYITAKQPKATDDDKQQRTQPLTEGAYSYCLLYNILFYYTVQCIIYV